MLIVNADDHPMMRRMHKPGPQRPADQQDRRSVVVIEYGDAEQWQRDDQADAAALIRARAMDVIIEQPMTANHPDTQ